MTQFWNPSRYLREDAYPRLGSAYTRTYLNMRGRYGWGSMSALTFREPAAAGSAQRTCRFEQELAASTTTREDLAATIPCGCR